MKTEDWIAQNKEYLIRLSDDLFQHPEQALQEEHAAEMIAKELAAKGFTIQQNLGGLQTAFSATWGSGKPVIGFLGEYDALAGMSQKPVGHKEAAHSGEPGHACGHNLLGIAPLGAVLALQATMKEKGLPGTISYFGCPAEEIMVGKIRMAADGCFDGLDVTLGWHPWQCNMVLKQDMLAMNTAKFTFSGIASHAAAAPEMGRSALDAVELMNVGANYLREHVPANVRIHYSITNGGGEPNLVPAEAQSWYYVRALRRDVVETVFDRICNIARGAALMTGTNVKIELLSGCWHILPNNVLNELLHECLQKALLSQWSPEEKEFASQLLSGTDSNLLKRIRGQMNGQLMENDLLHEQVLPMEGRQELVFGSTDVSDVTWIVPTAQFGACTAPIGANCHTWQFTACAGMSIGHKGMLYAARVLALAGLRLLEEANIIKRAQAEFKARKGDTVYQAVTPKIIQ
ncbi:MAG: amidohydrolase [Bacillota bacterium]|jgi:aminobenzoyl-glutamate utilization protein B